MDHTLIFHIGISKTGTSALQSFLYTNRRKLEQYGWCYPDLTKELFGLDFLNFGKEINGSVFYREREKIDTETENWDKAWQQVLMHLKFQNVILSDERICVWDTNKFLTEAKKRYDNIKVVIYLRRQDRAIESFWNQVVKNPIGCNQTFQEFIQSNGGLESSRYHYKKQLDDISKIVGKENLIVRVYEKEQLGGTRQTTESDFLSIIGIEPNWDQWEECAPQNLRLSGNFLEIKRIVNSIQLAEDIDIDQAISTMLCFGKLSQAFCKKEVENGYFSIQERIEFMEQFLLENEEIAREYLHRENGILFYDSKMNYPVPKQSVTSFEEDLIRVYMMLLYNQNKELKMLKKHNDILAQKLLLHNYARGREFLLFGAGCKCKVLLGQIQIPITIIVDNDESKSGKKLYDVEIISAKQIVNWSDYFVIVTSVETDEIEKQLQEFNLKKEEDYILAKEYFLRY